MKLKEAKEKNTLSAVCYTLHEREGGYNNLHSHKSFRNHVYEGMSWIDKVI